MVVIIVATVIKAELLLAPSAPLFIFIRLLLFSSSPFLLPLPAYATRKNCVQLNLIAPSFNYVGEDVILCTFIPTM